MLKVPLNIFCRLVRGVVAVLIWLSIFLMTLTSADHLSKEAVGSDHLTSLHSDIDYELDDDHKLAEDMPGAYPRLPFCTDLGSKATGDHDAENSSSADKQIQPTVQSFRGRFTIVATLDGQLSLLDHGGRKLWTIKTGQVFSSTISSIPLHENGKWVHMIPSLTGGLYRYDGDSLQPMPLNAEDLLLRSFKLSNDVVMSGGKEVRTYGIDLTTGLLRYECGMEGCSSPTAAEASAVENDNGVVLVVKKQMQTVRAIDSITGSEKWNFSVATHELALAGVQEGCYEGESKGGTLDSKIKVIIPDGLIMGAGPDNNSVWQHKFDHPIAQTWVLENGRLRIVDPIKHSVLDQTPALYIGQHAQQLYVQESQDTAQKLETAIASVSKREILPKPLEIGWKPSQDADPSLPASSHALTPYQHDFNGVYFYESDEIQSIHTGEFEEVPDDVSSGYIIDLPSVWHWWKEVLGFSLILAVVLNVLLMWPIARLIRDQTVRRMIELFRPILTQRANEIVAQEETKPLLVPALPAPVPNRRSRTRTLSNASTASQSYLDDSSSPFVSQYLREFEPITCLGRGGFGVVFEAKKKIDDRHYAVKRIILPNSEKSRGRVMREVKALAKLDHRNIVRYFNAWIENPPMGWLELNDPLYNSCLQEMSSGFYRSSIDVTATVDESRDCKIRGRREYCEVSFPKGESQGDDSYIIFAADGNSNKSVGSNGAVNGRMSGGDVGSTALLLKQSSESGSSSESGGLFRRPKSLNLTSMECSVNIGELDIVADEDVDKSDDENVFPSETYLYIQQELCQKKTLQEWLRVTKNRSHQQVVQMFSQIVEAVEYIHMNKLIHRDLKPGNIFLASSENASMENESMTVKIGDFGLATTGVHFENDAHTPSISPPVRVNLTGHVGTHMYMSPEQTRNEPYDFKVDIYSLGLIFYELLVPLTTDMERHESLSQIRKMKFPPWFVRDHELEHSILAQMVSHNPFKRPSASEIRTWLLKNLVGRPSKTFSTPTELGISSISSDATTETPEDKKRYNNNNDRERRFSKNHSFT